jgi:NTP pyrophosphatase (non-canonical NTP hydrolase)
MIKHWYEMTQLVEEHTGWFDETEYGLALFMEVAELVDSMNWNPWKEEMHDRENLKREIVDCLFFLHHIAEVNNISAAELEEKYNWVMENNKKRYNHDN